MHHLNSKVEFNANPCRVLAKAFDEMFSKYLGVTAIELGCESASVRHTVAVNNAE